MFPQTASREMGSVTRSTKSSDEKRITGTTIGGPDKYLVEITNTQSKKMFWVCVLAREGVAGRYGRYQLKNIVQIKLQLSVRLQNTGI